MRSGRRVRTRSSAGVPADDQLEGVVPRNWRLRTDQCIFYQISRTMNVREFVIDVACPTSVNPLVRNLFVTCGSLQQNLEGSCLPVWKAIPACLLLEGLAETTENQPNLSTRQFSDKEPHLSFSGTLNGNERLKQSTRNGYLLLQIICVHQCSSVIRSELCSSSIPHKFRVCFLRWIFLYGAGRFCDKKIIAEW